MIFRLVCKRSEIAAPFWGSDQFFCIRDLDRQGEHGEKTEDCAVKSSYPLQRCIGKHDIELPEVLRGFGYILAVSIR